MPEDSDSWVVYLMTGKKANGMKAVCQQSEWDAMERVNPGQQQLIQRGILTETEAELLARGVSGDPKPRISRPR